MAQDKFGRRLVSRRDFLNVAVIGGGAAIAISISSQASAAPKSWRATSPKFEAVDAGIARQPRGKGGERVAAST